VKGEWDGLWVEWFNSGDDNLAVPDMNSPGWEKIAEDRTSPYEDKRPNRTGAPEVRFYRFGYMKGEEMIGQYSAIIKVASEIYG